MRLFLERWVLTAAILLALSWLAQGQQLGFAVAPANDNLADAITVTGSSFELDADLAQATAQSFENYQAYYGIGHTAWWVWTAPDNGIYQWSALNSANMVNVAIFHQDGFGQMIPIASTYDQIFTSWSILINQTGSFQATQGVSYFIQVDATPESPYIVEGFGPGWVISLSMPVSVSFSKLNSPAPVNDDFSHRITLSSSNTIFTADLSAATAQEDEPVIASGVLHRTLWWTWQSPGYGTATIRKLSTNEPPVVGIYTRDVYNAFHLQASSATVFGNQCLSEPGAHDSVDWDTTPGGQYEIQVDRFPRYNASVPAVFEIDFSPAPTNDTVAGATIITGIDVSLTVSNTSATLRPNEPVIPGQSGSNSVWFKWTAPSKGILQVTPFMPVRFDDPTYGSDDDTFGFSWNQTSSYSICGDVVHLHPPLPFVPVFALYYHDNINNPPGTPDSLATYGTNGFMAELFSARDYWVELDGDKNTSGQTAMNLLLIPPPANDDFTNRIVLPPEGVKVTGRTFAATTESSDPASYGTNNMTLTRSVWWEWSAPKAGRWALSVINSGSQNEFVIYRGGAPVKTNEVCDTQNAPIIFNCAAGEVFEIGVAALVGVGGNYGFTITPVLAPVPQITALDDDWDDGYRSVTLNMPGNLGLTYVIDQSVDLIHWTPILTNANSQSQTLQIQSGLGRANEFFRTRLIQ